MHSEKSPLAGTTVRLKNTISTTAGVFPAGTEYEVLDWWDHLTGGSWGAAKGNPACLIYAIRTAVQRDPVVPPDDEVLYGHIGAFGHLVHIMEVEL